MAGGKSIVVTTFLEYELYKEVYNGILFCHELIVWNVLRLLLNNIP